MKKYFLKKRIFALIFIVALISFAGVNAYHSYEGLILAWNDKDAVTLDEKIAVVEDEINELFYHRKDFIEVFSYTNELLDKKEISNFEFIKDSEGFLYYSSFFKEDSDEEYEYALRIKRLKDYVDANETKVFFLVTPDKYIPFEREFRTGLPANDLNPTTDELLMWLNRFGVKTIDYRKYLPNDDLSYEETFFKTDHHWTVPAAYKATEILVDKINENIDAKLDFDKYEYEEIIYEDAMIGSMGEKVGANFSGIEDFVFLKPVSDENYTYTKMQKSNEEEVSYGNINEILIDYSVFEEDVSNKYFSYLNGLNYYDSIINESNPDGPTALFIRDSYASPMITFLAPVFSKIDAIWCLEDLDDLDVEQIVKDNVYDYIIIEIYPYNINDEAFNYFRDIE